MVEEVIQLVKRGRGCTRKNPGDPNQSYARKH